MKCQSTTALWAIAVVLFVAGVVVHIWCGDFPKAIDVLPDERRYLDIARSLFAGEGLIIRGTDSSFQKILYPLSLFPALVFDTGQEQIKAINVLNSIYACSSVFPALLIARKLFHRSAALIGCMVFAVVAPDLMYSMTFMSESTFFPLALWLVFLCWRCFESSGKRELLGAGCAGLLCYVTYLCKEVAWMFLIAFAIVYIVAAIRKRRTKKRAIACIALFIACFFIPFIALKLTLFAGLQNSYSQLSLDILLSPYTILFGLYSIAVDSIYFVVGFGVFPVLFVACTYREFTREERDLALFCLISLLVGLAVVVFTISMREDVGHVALRQHLRYVAPLALPLLFLFVRQGIRLKPECVTLNPHRLAVLVGVTVGFCCLVMTFFVTANLSQGFDNSQFHVLRWLLKESPSLPQDYFDSWKQTMSGIATDDGDLLSIEPISWLIRFIVIAFTAAGMALLLNRDIDVRRTTTMLIAGAIGAFMIANSMAAFDYNRKAYGVEQTHIDEICSLSDQLKTIAATPESGEIVVVLDESNTGPNNLIDTYLQDGSGRYHYIEVKALEDYLTSVTPTGSLRNPVEYVLANDRQSIGKVAEEGEIIGGNGSGDGRFTLYRLKKNPNHTEGLPSEQTPIDAALSKLFRMNAIHPTANRAN